MEVLNEATGEVAKFHCQRWLAKDEDDGKTSRELVAGGKHYNRYAFLTVLTLQSTNVAETSHGSHGYKVTIVTGDRPHAGTSANVYCELVGIGGTTGKLQLENHRKNFERARTDVFHLDTADLGQLKHVVVGHDDKGLVSHKLHATLKWKVTCACRVQGGS